MTRYTISRRRVLGGLAVSGALATSGAVALPPRPAAAAASAPLPSKVDVVVVGGGISGLVAARQVAKAGRSVLLLEARNRVGGRVLNHTLANGSVIESGGAFVGPTQDNILALAAELGVATFKEYDQGQNVYLSHGVATYYTGTVPPDPAILPDAAALQVKIDQMSQKVPVDAPWTAPDAAAWDATSLHDWIQANTVNPATANLLKSFLEPDLGANARDVSLLFFLWYMATAGDANNPGTFERAAGTSGGAQDSRFVGGSQLVPLRLAAQLGDIVALQAPVRRIEQTGGQVVMTSDRGQVTAGHAIVAVPPPLAAAIDWNPLLPPVRMQLLQRMSMGALMKVDAVYPTPFWRAAGLTGQSIQDVPPVRASFDNSPPDASVGVLMAFIGGATWRDWGNRSLADRRAGVLQAFANAFGPQALSPIDYVEHDWTAERWTLGAPVAIAGVGTVYGDGSTIRTPHGLVHWAGTETATYWSGYMDGAVSAGLRAAAEVLG
ncbi:MAG TPA: FAD-dependent oxidoreductase [Streptosporangiaceae bacterium]|nr:FAD-dependent oxidoreductase [Streptosporangiaceae bacterium]